MTNTRVAKILNKVIKSHNYTSHCMPMQDINIHTYYRIREDAPHADLVVFDKNYDNFNSIRTAPYFMSGTDILLRYLYRGKYEPFKESDFKYVVLYPSDEKMEGLCVIPSTCLIDLSKNDNTLYYHFHYNDYINWSHGFMTSMLTNFHTNNKY